jgi:hypothetical protein
MLGLYFYSISPSRRNGPSGQCPNPRAPYLLRAGSKEKRYPVKHSWKAGERLTSSCCEGLKRAGSPLPRTSIRGSRVTRTYSHAHPKAFAVMQELISPVEPQTYRLPRIFKFTVSKELVSTALVVEVSTLLFSSKTASHRSRLCAQVATNFHTVHFGSRAPGPISIENFTSDYPSREQSVC